MKAQRGPPSPQINPPKVGGSPMGAPPHLGRPLLGLPHGGPHLPKTCSTICGGLPPPWGPPNILPPKGGCPPKGGPPIKHSPRIMGSCPPSGDTVFFTRVLSGKILEGPRTFPAPSKKFWTCVPKPFWLDGLLRNNFSVSPKLFRFSLRNIFGVSETFPVTFSQTPCLVLSR